MTKAMIRKLRVGQEIFNTNTGEVACFTGVVGTVGSTIYIGSMDQDGRAHIWSHNQTERV